MVAASVLPVDRAATAATRTGSRVRFVIVEAVVSHDVNRRLRCGGRDLGVRGSESACLDRSRQSQGGSVLPACRRATRQAPRRTRGERHDSRGSMPRNVLKCTGMVLEHGFGVASQKVPYHDAYHGALSDTPLGSTAQPPMTPTHSSQSLTVTRTRMPAPN